MNRSFLSWLNSWYSKLPSIKLAGIGDPKKVALVSEDMVIGFCRKGNLASPEVGVIVPKVVKLFKRLYTYGVRHFLLFQDTHDPHAEEFLAYPPHCLKGTDESKTVPELSSLPFADKCKIFEKNSLSSFHGTTFEIWLDEHKEVDTFVIAGNCTDICVYQAAIDLRTRADAINKKRRIIVVSDCTATYGMPIDRANKLGALPHDSGFLHKIFLYHLRLNGVEVVKEII